MSWSLNVFSQLQPALCHIYAKLAGKNNKFTYININKGVKDDLEWFLKHVKKSGGILVFDAIDWHPLINLDLIIQCDACLTSMGF